MIDWQEIFIPSHSVLETIVRGTMIYIMLFLILRFLLKRQTGVIGVADLLVIVLIADASQNAMASEYKSVTEGIVLVLTIVFWNYAIDWLGFHFPAFQRITRPPPLLLIENGKMLPRNMRQEMITIDELKSQLREQGIEHCSEVKRAYIEGDGTISIIRKDKDDVGGKTETMKGVV
ncbi:DUF421 domain-containing protein [Microvirga mediterraneensis]|uniref:DUF421 domain-containing protein n=1 Tax=Microvirga mediterraneensis TaxID=2754695 RepID=A0A838BM47_9HYPH|nr:YetF domain-containing protein [Microvirga mediterraneensis]MBA1156411.1 DUF421 domain-containing protein [Microvirga mediterraneensis]